MNVIGMIPVSRLTTGDALTAKNRDAAMNNKEVTRILASQGGMWGMYFGETITHALFMMKVHGSWAPESMRQKRPAQTGDSSVTLFLGRCLEN